MRFRWGLALVLVLGLSRAFADPSAGATLFQKNCVVCHRANGSGTPGLAPPIQNNPGRFAGSPEGRRQLVWTLLYGMYGDVVINDRHYNFKMPIFSQLHDDDIANLLNFLVGEINAKPELATFTDAEVRRERDVVRDGSEVLKHRGGL
jgi:mono/diheme cytochrome c family protein